MKEIAAALEDFFEVITDLVDFIFQLFEDLLLMIQLLGKFIVNIPNYFNWLPSDFVSVTVVLFSIVVIYKILGREG